MSGDATIRTTFQERTDIRLLFDFDTEFLKAVGKGVFIDFLKMPESVIKMDGIGGLADKVEKFVDVG